MRTPQYSIAVCNYNMAATLEASLRSMLDQTDERFEVVVVDGGSTDGSRDILHDLADEYDRLRPVLDRADEGDHLGGDRAISVQESRGEYVLVQLDADDRYFDGVIPDFTAIYHAIEDSREQPFFLSGTGMNMAPKELLTRVPYRDLAAGEDRDLWRRLAAEDALVWLDHGPVSEQIGYEMKFPDQFRRNLDEKTTDFQSGVSFWSAMRWALDPDHDYVLEERRSPPAELAKRVYDLVTFPYAYVKAIGREHHATPREFREKGSLERWIVEHQRTLSDLEDEYGFELDRESLSENGRRAFDR